MAQTPDLNAILAQLAQYTQPVPFQPAISKSPAPGREATNTFQLPNVSAYGTDTSATSNVTTVQGSARSQDARSTPQHHSSTPSNARPIIDPAAITTWQDGLRCVTKIAAQSRSFEASIQKIMQDQRAHEMRWYSERQALKQAQANRPASSAKVLSILQNLNPTASSEAVPTQTETEKQIELDQLDRKIYTAQKSMETAMTAELKGLGVPFFGTLESLIIKEPRIEQQSETHAKWSPPVTESQLLELRRRMIAHLEDLYRN